MIRLEEISLSHAADIQALAIHPDILATTNMPDPYPEDGAEVFIRETMELRKQQSRVVFAILENQTLVGTVGLHNIQEGVAELGYWVGRPFWGKGIGWKATAMAVAYAFSELKLEMLTSHCLVTNRASFHLLEKNGFHLTAVKPMSDCKWTGQPMAFFELRREMWETGQGI